jgi:hypothetical protein
MSLRSWIHAGVVHPAENEQTELELPDMCKTIDRSRHSRLRSAVRFSEISRVYSMNVNCTTSCKRSNTSIKITVGHVVVVLDWTRACANSIFSLFFSSDGLIMLHEYLTFEPNEAIDDKFGLFTFQDVHLRRIYFHLMDVRRTGAIAWSEFSLFYTCKLITLKNKVDCPTRKRTCRVLAALQADLTTKLTCKELIQAKDLFLDERRQRLNNERHVEITRDYLQQVMNNLVGLLR